MRAFRVKTIIDGPCSGEPVFLDQKISFFGEIEPRTGLLTGRSVSIAGKPLIIPGTRGSTVGPYILYALKEYGKNPVCIIASEIEPILIIGCIIAEIPLFKLEDNYLELIDYLRKCKKPYIVLDKNKEALIVYEKKRVFDSH